MHAVACNTGVLVAAISTGVHAVACSIGVLVAVCNSVHAVAYRIHGENVFRGILYHEQQLTACCQTHSDYGPSKMPLNWHCKLCKLLPSMVKK